jgi:hypothetical protein
LVIDTGTPFFSEKIFQFCSLLFKAHVHLHQR